jgi:hypothetical protein
MSGLAERVSKALETVLPAGLLFASISGTHAEPGMTPLLEKQLDQIVLAVSQVLIAEA